MDERQERDVEFIIAHKYLAKPFELLKESFNHMALLIGMPVHMPRIIDIDLRRNCIDSILRINAVLYRLCTIGFIADDIASLDINLAEQRDGILGIVVIAGTEQKSKRIT